ncbi:DUF3310 domain-containing protein [Campylobacter hyointestinalis]|uniref:Protein of unknwon function (DUF3310) n=1 Tax=Campylobacter hyointestinalis subsp. hyointestinalis TaxID=91352 RepID=A0A9W5AQQ5_CAMHY|nr:DUF3310 domain-containing protein [Campylobacter hyointestinalis]CUU75247.1 Protein of unknwon function (DUF3310) [Campylobacter hyointestinalis subsp. hyointestinalis]CUU82579.1 Protein of unknwon function (DUF3310) [Campylobacter hyointestinalis subsp. hyointestinalis]
MSDYIRDLKEQIAIAQIEQCAHSYQIGGNHYQKMVIQPIDFIIQNELSFPVGSAVKYLCRYKEKGGVEDLKKARHYIDFLIEEEECKNES